MITFSAFSAIFQSTHSVGSGTVFSRPRRPKARFQSTHSVGSGTGAETKITLNDAISIHPLRGEWDVNVSCHSCTSQNFNPPTPWGVGPMRMQCIAPSRPFQSTHSVGSGTKMCALSRRRRAFQSTHSVGSGTVCRQVMIRRQIFQSTHSVGSGTRSKCEYRVIGSHFNPPTPWGVGL